MTTPPTLKQVHEFLCEHQWYGMAETVQCSMRDLQSTRTYRQDQLFQLVAAMVGNDRVTWRDPKDLVNVAGQFLDEIENNESMDVMDSTKTPT